MATSEPSESFTAGDIQLADAIVRVFARALKAIESHERIERERDQALAVLRLAGTPYAVSDPRVEGVQVSDAARRMLANVVDADERLQRLLTRPATYGASHHVEVELATGGTANLSARLSPVDDEDGTLVALLEIERDRPGIPEDLLAILTPREQEVAVQVVEGLGDRAIAEQLCLSHHTVSQYVKRIYRKLGVGSRVGLTRAVLGTGGSVRR